MSLINLIYAFGIACGMGSIFTVISVVRAWNRINLLKLEIRQKKNEFGWSDDSFTPIRLNQHNWAKFEGSIPDLKQVVVVADRVQDPTNSLRAAVLRNFGRGVNYCFIVSKSKAGEEVHGYLEFFKAMARMAISKNHLADQGITVDNLVSIQTLTDTEWDGCPFVLYRFGPSAGKLRTIAFRGSQRKSGISSSYMALPADVADMIAVALFSGAPQPVKEALENIQEDTFVSYSPTVFERDAPNFRN